MYQVLQEDLLNSRHNIEGGGNFNGAEKGQVKNTAYSAFLVN